MLHLKNAVLGYDKSRVLRGVTLTIEPGECIGLIGPNGGGKSTLLRTMAGLLPPLKGDVSFKELSMGSWKRKELARHIAYLPQNCPVPFAYRALDVVLLGQYAHLSWWRRGGEDEARARQCLALVGMEQFAEQPVTVLSGGQKQRVMLARTLMQQGELYLLDEPTASLDPIQENDVFRILQSLSHHGKSVVTALHDLTQAVRFCSRLILVGGGRIIRDGTWEEVLQDEAVSEAYGMPCHVRRNGDSISLVRLAEEQQEEALESRVERIL
ncbi:MAG: ABC transporter ATP-binding protein [Acidaminococcus sp.]|jgi:iron complex transport system ATP-binding protein|nr:ABC transporter ATP-binding protein [Acidaminococcus sp.]MCI2100822.1 ABC transporter ATP-binding protein [Acidaminococcus sp.]MCI2115185.1 ABC transporter ATP-binding protein [Acidaminococcus sp.]MCI2117260.1 ABC transporter ATP-binding protein [Acidaminococcus sp.]